MLIALINFKNFNAVANSRFSRKKSGIFFKTLLKNMMNLVLVSKTNKNAVEIDVTGELFWNHILSPFSFEIVESYIREDFLNFSPGF